MFNCVAHQVVKNALVNTPVGQNNTAQICLLFYVVAVTIQVITNIDIRFHIFALKSVQVGR
jgi:hypothetical protein